MTQRNINGRIIASIVLVGFLAVAADRANAWPWPWVNPEIANTGAQVTGAYFDPFTGRFVVRTDKTRVRESFLDPSRSFVDPGSKHYVDEVQVDAYGVQWRVRGWKWTSNGVPHGNVQRTRISATGIPGVDQEENDRVLFSHRPGNNGNQEPGQRVGGQQRADGQRIGGQRIGRPRIGNARRSTLEYRLPARRAAQQRSSGGYNPF